MLRNACLTLLLVPSFFLLAQGPPPGGPGRGNATPPKPAYQVHSDGTVTFELLAPEATDVKLSCDCAQGPQALKKSDDGVWSVTLGPLHPALYNYTYLVNGVRVLDPFNPMIKLGERTSESMFEIPAAQPAPYDWQPVPHGTVHVSWYLSKTLDVPRRVDVYTPPGYESNNQRYPVLYLLHGSGDTEQGWTSVGHANLILDNLIAAGQAKPMIIVMPYGRAQQDVYLPPGAPPKTDPNAFGSDLLDDVMPYVEKLYRISAKPDDRALAGLSMGGGQTLRVGLSHMDLFHSIGAFSAGIGRNPNMNFEEMFKDAFADPAVTNKKLKVFYIACGKADGLFPASQGLSEALDKKEIKHTFVASEEGHVWRNWRTYLADFAPKLFR